MTIKVLEPLVSADALGATDFNIRVEYSLEATAPTLEAVTAEARVTDAVIRSRDLSLEQQGVGRLTLRKGVATLAPWTIAAKSTTTTQVTRGRIGHARWHAPRGREGGRTPRPADVEPALRHLPSRGHRRSSTRASAGR